MLRTDFAANVADVSDFDFVELSGYGGNYKGGKQSVRFFAEMEGASAGAVASLRVAMVSEGGTIWFDDAVLTATAVDGVYGKVATVVFGLSGRGSVDALGADGSLTVDRWRAGATDAPHLRLGVVSGITGAVTGVRVWWSSSAEL